MTTIITSLFGCTCLSVYVFVYVYSRVSVHLHIPVICVYTCMAINAFVCIYSCTGFCVCFDLYVYGYLLVLVFFLFFFVLFFFACTYILARKCFASVHIFVCLYGNVCCLSLSCICVCAWVLARVPVRACVCVSVVYALETMIQV